MIVLRSLKIAVVFILIATSGWADEKREALINYIKSNVPAYVRLDQSSLQYKDFSSGNGQGRLSFVAKTVLNESLVEKQEVGSVTKRPSFPNLQKSLNDLGFSNTEISAAMKENGFFNNSYADTARREFVTVNSKGSTTNINGEINYLETVSGITLHGSFRHPSLRGVPRSLMRRGDYVAFTPEFSRIVQRLSQTIEKLNQKSSGTIGLVKELVDQELFLNYRYRGKVRSDNMLSILIETSPNDFKISSWQESYRRGFGSSVRTRTYKKDFVTRARVLTDNFSVAGVSYAQNAMLKVRLTIEVDAEASNLDNLVIRISVQNSNSEWSNLTDKIRYTDRRYRGSSGEKFLTEQRGPWSLLSRADLFPVPVPCTGKYSALKHCEIVALNKWSVYYLPQFIESFRDSRCGRYQSVESSNGERFFEEAFEGRKAFAAAGGPPGVSFAIYALEDGDEFDGFRCEK